MWHVSNLYEIPEAERVARRLCEASFADVVFFCNSGAEAMECAIKMARKYQSANERPERYRIITFEGAFHGRTLATLAAGGQKKYLEGFGPVVDGFDQVPFGDLDATKRAIAGETAAILIEPIMGEGGVRVVEPSFLRALRELCDQHGLLLIFDEVQTGMGRTGELFAYQRTGVAPDIMALAKALGGGFPVGACLATTRGGEGNDRRHPRLDLRRQSAGDERRQCRARRDAGARLSSTACGGSRSCSSSGWRKSRTAILSLIAEVRGEGLLIGLRALDSGRRTCRCAARREDDHGRRGRQCRATAAAAHRQRAGNRRGDRAPRSRLRPAQPRGPHHPRAGTSPPLAGRDRR